MNEDKKFKVLVVDDSAFMRKVITDILQTYPNIGEIETAFNGQVALRKLKEFDPDVVTLDIEMPVMDGITTLQEILKVKRIPVIMCSSLTKAGAEITIKALELGAFDFIQKPESVHGDKIKELEKALFEKVMAAVSSKNIAPVKVTPQIKPNLVSPSPTGKRTKLLMIASSTGGPQALKEVVPYLPENIPAKIVMVQHMPEKFTEMFAQRLDKMSKISVKEAKEGDMLEEGKALLAPGNFHMLVTERGSIALNQEPSVLGVRPCADLTIASLAKTYKEDVILVVLTGMGHDGMQGSTAVKKYGGYCIVEDESTCIVYGMPKSVVQAGNADEILPIHKIAEAIIKRVYS